MNKDYVNAINTLKKYQEIVERAFQVKYPKDVNGYREKADALEDFKNMNRAVNKAIYEFDALCEFEQRMEAQEDLIQRIQGMKDETN